MKLSRRIGWIGISAAVTAGLLAVDSRWQKLVPVAHAADNSDDSCSVGSLRGLYALNRQGTLFTPAPVPYGEVGIFTFDGDGHLSGTVTVNIGGTLHPGINVTGTYTVNSDCSGTNTVMPTGFPPLHNAFVVTGNGKGYIATQTDSFAVIQSSVQRLRGAKDD
jgi:hypothetical protein